jgi:mercuric ion transport protein
MRVVATPPSPKTAAPRLSVPALALAALSALLASGCCVFPLVLALVGVSGSWIGQLRHLAPWSPWLAGLSFAALAFAAWRLYRPSLGARACAAEGDACGPVGRAIRRWFWLVAALALVPVLVPLAAPLFY